MVIMKKLLLLIFFCVPYSDCQQIQISGHLVSTVISTEVYGEHFWWLQNPPTFCVVAFESPSRYIFDIYVSALSQIHNMQDIAVAALSQLRK